MQYIRWSWFTRFFIVPLTLLALLSGCYKWSTPSQTPADLIRLENPSKVRLNLKDGRRFVVKNPVVTESAISGHVRDSLVTIQFEDIEQLEQRRFNPASVVVPAILIALMYSAVRYGM